MPFWVLLLSSLTGLGTASGWQADPLSSAGPVAASGCSSTRPRMLLGLLARPLSLAEMVTKLERGCLALEEVRFRPGGDSIESLSPAQLAQIARALGMAHGAYRVAVPPEGTPPDTLQARRRGTRLRDELVRYGASSDRLREDSGWAVPPFLAVPGAAAPMLVRVPEP